MLLDKLFFAKFISLLKVIPIDWKILKSFILFYVRMLVTDVAVSSSHDRKPSMSCILYPMMNFSPQHWQTVYIFKTKFIVDLVYLYRTNFQNVDTVVVSNNTTDTCSAPLPNLTPTGGSSITLTRILTCNFSFPYFSIGVCPRTSQHVAPCWFSMNGCSRNYSERESRVVEGAHFVYYT